VSTCNHSFITMGCCFGKNDEDAKRDYEVKALRDAQLPVIWVLGGPGSGRNTQCEKLCETYGFKNLCMGDLLRAEVASGSDLGKSIYETMERGELVDRNVALDLLKKAMLNQFDTANGYLIRGYPKNIQQAQDFEKKARSVQHGPGFDVL